MTNENAVLANADARPKMTREQMQTEALIIESLLNAAMALHSGTKSEDSLTMVEMAHDRACQLNRALDSINMPEGFTNG